MELYIIRHAQSANNALANQSDREQDPKLTELGRKQAELLARHLASEPHPEQRYMDDPEKTGVETVRGYGINRLYCSAMHRSLETATAVGNEIGVQPEIWCDVHETGGIFLNHGGERGIVGYPGMTRSEIQAKFPAVEIGTEVSEKGWWDPSAGEEDWAICQGRAIRVARTLWGMADRGETGPLALVSHAGFMEALFKALLNSLPAPGLTVYHFNTAITRVDLAPGRELHLRYLNRVPHLPQDLVS